MEGTMPFGKIYYGFYYQPNIYIIVWAVSQSENTSGFIQLYEVVFFPLNE